MTQYACYPSGIGVAPVPMDVGTQGGAQPGSARVVPVPVVPPFYQVRPPNARDFYAHFSGTVAAGAGATVAIAAAPELTFPNSDEAIITDLSIGVLNALGTLAVTVAVRYNGSAIPGLGALVPWPVPGVLSLLEASGRHVWLSGGGTVDVLVVNTSAAGPWSVLVDVWGYQYATSDRIRVVGSAEGLG